jgi:hypothetical protein
MTLSGSPNNTPKERHSLCVSVLPPRQVWIAAFLLALLRSFPFWKIFLLSQNPEKNKYLLLSYIPKDWLAYVSLVQQPIALQGWFLSNPFTTDPQDGRFILLYHHLLNWIHKITGMDPFWIVELSRWPLTFIFMWVLWRLLEVILARDSERLWAIWLIAFSGGIEVLIQPILQVIPEQMARHINQELWHLYGWSTFGAAFNPLWLCGLSGLLVILRPMIHPEGPTHLKDKVIIWFGLILLWFTHVYSALMALGILCGVLAIEWMFIPVSGKKRARHVVIPVLSSLLVVGGFLFWQRQDPVFAASSGGVLGHQAASIFWYPVTLGAVGVFSLWGWKLWISECRAWRFALAGWTIAVIFMHASTVFNGYHFVFGLHVPLSIVASSFADTLFKKNHRQKLKAVAYKTFVIFILFTSPFFITYKSLQGIEQSTYLPQYVVDLLDDLEDAPPGNIVSDPLLGNIIPALTPHRVWIGHWFMTPDYRKRIALYSQFINNPEANKEKIKALLNQQDISYLLVPISKIRPFTTALGPLIRKVKTYESLAVLYI